MLKRLLNWQAVASACVFVLCAASPSQAKDIFVAQNALGNADGTSSASAYALAWLNAATNWGSAGNIQPGDTVHLIGTFTNTLSVAGSGTAGNPITILFEPGANFTAAAWGNPYPASDNFTADPIISTVANLSYIIIDGGVNGLITSTSNGLGLSHSNNCAGVVFSSAGAGLEIRNLTVSNLYYRIPGAANDFGGASGIKIRGNLTNCSIHNCAVQTVGNAISAYFNSGVSTNVQIYSNTIVDVSWGIAFGNQQSNSLCIDSSIWANRINHFESYTGNPTLNHQDGIICYTTMFTQTNRNLRIFRNYIGPDIATNQTTAAIFVNDTQYSGSFENLLIYNNLLTAKDGNAWANGFIAADGNPSQVYNNTLVSTTGNPQGNAVYVHSGHMIFVNNLCYNVGNILGQAISGAPGMQPTLITNSDYNIGFKALYWWTPGSFNWGGSTSYRDHATYPQFTGFDDHTSTNPPSLDASYAPISGDTVAIGKGTNLTALGITADFYGNSRPATGPWTIGAFEIPGTSTSMSPPNVHTPRPSHAVTR
jgi:hypothetical protein